MNADTAQVAADVPAVAVVGEALIDMIGSGGAEFTAVPGGAPANVAVGLARLGVPAYLLARLSDDRFGALLRARAVDNGVGVEPSVATRRPTTLAIAALGDAGVADYSFYVEGTADWHWRREELRIPPDTRVLVFGSLAAMIEPGAGVIAGLAAEEYRRDRLLVCYDPNIRPALARSREVERARVEAQIRSAHVVKASEDDLRWLYPHDDVVETARRWQERTGGLVVVTRGADGAVAIRPGGEPVAVPGRPVALVDTVGAGDAFLAGMIASTLRNGLLAESAARTVRDLDTAAVRGLLADAVTAASLTCRRAGAEPPTLAELDAAR